MSSPASLDPSEKLQSILGEDGCHFHRCLSQIPIDTIWNSILLVKFSRNLDFYIPNLSIKERNIAFHFCVLIWKFEGSE